MRKSIGFIFLVMGFILVEAPLQAGVFDFCKSLFRRPKIVNTPDLSKPIKKGLPSVEQAILKVDHFFNAYRALVFERDFLVEPMIQMLLTKGNMIIIGPPGATKTRQIRLLRENILFDGQPRGFALQLTPETSLTEQFGPIDYPRMQQTGEIERRTQDGALVASVIHFDEIADASSRNMRDALTFMEDNQFMQGNRIYPGHRELFFGTTNRSIPEIYERAGNNDPQAWLNRFTHVAIVSNVMLGTNSHVQLHELKGEPMPQLDFDHILALRELMRQVQTPTYVRIFIGKLWNDLKRRFEEEEDSLEEQHFEDRMNAQFTLPYERGARQWNPRTERIFVEQLRAKVTLEYARGQRSSPVVTVDDVANFLPDFFILAPSDAWLGRIKHYTPLRREAAMMDMVIQQRAWLREVLVRQVDQFSQSFSEPQITEIMAMVQEWNPGLVSKAAESALAAGGSAPTCAVGCEVEDHLAGNRTYDEVLFDHIKEHGWVPSADNGGSLINLTYYEYVTETRSRAVTVDGHTSEHSYQVRVLVSKVATVDVDSDIKLVISSKDYQALKERVSQLRNKQTEAKDPSGGKPGPMDEKVKAEMEAFIQTVYQQIPPELDHVDELTIALLAFADFLNQQVFAGKVKLD